jgi:transcriptional regulator with XRE-family HTH domain
VLIGRPDKFFHFSDHVILIAYTTNIGDTTTMKEGDDEPRVYLRACLKERGLSQPQLAAALGIKHPAVAGWLSGNRPIPPHQAVKMRRLYAWNDEILCPDLREYREGVEQIDPSDRTNPLARRLQDIVELLNRRGWPETAEHNVVLKIERIVDEHVKMAERLKEIHRLSVV